MQYSCLNTFLEYGIELDSIDDYDRFKSLSYGFFLTSTEDSFFALLERVSNGLFVRQEALTVFTDTINRLNIILILHRWNITSKEE